MIVKSRSITEAHFKSLRLFRKYCRYMPFLINLTGSRKFTNPEQAKLQLARHWRQQCKVRDPAQLDMFVSKGYERLYNVQNGDIWGSILLDQISSPSHHQTITANKGYSFMDDVKYENKSDFLKDFYKGGKRVQF